MSELPFKRRRVCVVTATRAEYGLLYWLLRALQDDPQIELQLVVTGAHLSPAHGMTVRNIESDGFYIAERLPILLQDDSPQGITKSLGLATLAFADVFARLKPDILVLLGDRYEMLGAAQAAMIALLPIAHIHGGEATEGLIDEAIRHSITKMAHLHFVAADDFRRRVIQLGEDPGRVWVVGALGLDNIARLPLLDRETLAAQLGVPLASPCLLVTYHPVTLRLHESGETMQRLLDVVDKIAGTVILTGVNADTGGSAMREVAERFAIARPRKVLLAESLGALRYLSAVKHADAVVGNSSSGLLEAPALGTPTVDIGERQQGRLRAPSVIHCTAEEQNMAAAIRHALSPAHRLLAARRETPYGTPGAAERMLSVLRVHPLEGLLVKRFHNLPVQL
jgi:UDP-hydrolysing UDP-N-acetyl-D-glucosamine 2-epimerase